VERARVTDVMEGWGQPGGSQEFERGLRKVAQRGGESFSLLFCVLSCIGIREPRPVTFHEIEAPVFTSFAGETIEDRVYIPSFISNSSSGHPQIPLLHGILPQLVLSLYHPAPLFSPHPERPLHSPLLLAFGSERPSPAPRS